MKTTLYRFFLLFILLAGTTAISNAASEAEYKKMAKAWTLNADGSQEYRYSMELTLFTHTAMNSTYGESFILYNPRFQEIQFHSSYTKQVDGTVIETPENAFVEVLPRFAADAPAYNHLLEMVVVHTGLELGATIYLDYSILTKPGYYPALDIDEILQETSPVKEYNVSVTVPENSPLHRQLYAFQTKETQTKTNGQKQITWTLRNIPASSREAFQPQNKNGAPRLTASTYVSHTEALSSLNQKFSGLIRMEAETNAQYITENANNNTDKLQIIHNHIVRNMGTSQIPPEQTGYTIRPIDTVLRSAYGTVAEKTELLQVMLNAAGIPAETVVIYPGTLDKEACGLKAIKGWAVKAKPEGKDIYLSAVSMSPPAIPHRGDLDKPFTLKGEEISVQIIPVEADEQIDVNVSSDQAINGFVVCTLPNSAKGIDTWHMSSLSSRREELFEIPSLLKQKVTYTVTTEEGLQLQAPVQTKTIDKPFGSFSQTTTQQGDKITVVRTIELNKLQYTPAEYRELRTLINEWMNPTGKILLFSTAKP